MDLRAILMGAAFALMWSSAFSSARIIVADAPPLMALSLRFFLSGLIGVALAAALGQHWRLTPAQWRATIIFGVCQNALYLGLNFVAMQTIEASLAAIIASSLPLAVAAVGWLLLRQRLPWLGVAGLAAGFAGVVMIMGGRMGVGGVDPFGLTLCIIGVGALTFATMAVRGASSGGNLLMIVGLQMLVGSAVLAPFALALETPEVRWSTTLVVAFVYTLVVPGLLATWVWFLLVQRIGAVRAATFHFLNPFFGVAIAAMVLGEAVGPLDVLGVAVVMAGILAVQWARAPAQGVVPPTER
ncbi:DMT family transporter [Rhodobaculum claviforme]|uniref:EamA family transporter n=1 Tax=Rhodobaculum claviforme TaxID=1549854 RepID=A0A934TF23_9RHOB|nr:DMT family transporter [Rhodobaculum claviforme]MBK5926015.1 EamA family transporter [Rhodobaculum claviforme]